MTASGSVISMTKYFAVAASSPQVAGELLKEWERRSAQTPGLHLYALVDCLLIAGFVDFCVQQGWQPPVSVYAGQPDFDRVREWSPCLLMLPEVPDRLAQQVLSQLLMRCSGRPALGFIVSKHPIEVVKAQLMRLAGVTDDDGSHWVLRFGDTRVWPPAQGLLTPAQHAHAFAGIDAWMVVDRHGQLQFFDGSPDTSPASPNDFVTDFRITEQQFIRMSDLSEADSHLARLADTPAHALLAHSPIEQYDIARQCLATLDRFGIHGEQERYRYIRFALRFPGDCEQHPAVQCALLAASRKEGALSALLAALPAWVTDPATPSTGKFP